MPFALVGRFGLRDFLFFIAAHPFPNLVEQVNNLQVVGESAQQKVIAENPALREAYFLHYLLDMETRGSPSLLNIAAFADPTAFPS